MNSDKYTLAIIDGEPRIVNKKTGVPIPVDEPVFLLRGKDSVSLGIVRFYRLSLEEKIDSSSDLALGVDNMIESFAGYRKANPQLVKLPD